MKFTAPNQLHTKSTSYLNLKASMKILKVFIASLGMPDPIHVKYIINF